MVPDKRKGVAHDFLRDPIQLVVDGEWLRAEGTTLGADNGIGVAMALAVLDSKDVAHGAIEALFTVDEEQSLAGAEFLRENWLQSPYLINLDSEEEGEIIVGCAGGNCINASYPIKKEAAPADSFFAHLTVEGLAGGHSGCDIHEGHANGIKLLAALLGNFLRDDALSLRIASLSGGSKHNAIPIEASAMVAVPTAKKEDLRIAFNLFTANIEREYSKTDTGMKWTLQSTEQTAEVFSQEQAQRLIQTLVAVQNGVYAFDQENPALVHTSDNIAILTTTPESVELMASQRSDSEFDKQEVTRAVEAALRLGGASVITIDGDYPGWTPVYNSHLLQVAQESHEALTGHVAAVKTIHAGLECGLISKKYPKMEMISIGPTLRGVHTPEEKLYIPAMSIAWQHLTHILTHL
jgi:dipeptidase D